MSFLLATCVAAGTCGDVISVFVHLGQVPQLSRTAHNMRWGKFCLSQAPTSSPDLWRLLSRSTHGYC